MAALGETIVETADALMTTEQEMQGTTATSLLAARDLLQIIARQIELRAAVLIMDPDANNQVH
jgi:rRNA processing protein Krr1/Pno1